MTDTEKVENPKQAGEDNPVNATDKDEVEPSSPTNSDFRKDLVKALNDIADLKETVSQLGQRSAEETPTSKEDESNDGISDEERQRQADAINASLGL